MIRDRYNTPINVGDILTTRPSKHYDKLPLYKVREVRNNDNRRCGVIISKWNEAKNISIYDYSSVYRSSMFEVITPKKIIRKDPLGLLKIT